MKPITLNVNGRIVTAVTVAGLAKIVGKSRNTILRYERLGVFPPAPLRVGNYRYYSVTLAKSLAPLVQQLPLHTRPDADIIARINKLFSDERSKYAN